MNVPQFKIESYDLDIYVDKKYVGSIHNHIMDRTVFGYHGRNFKVLMEDFKTKKGKTIKKGTLVMTELIPICGKLIKQ